MADRTRLAAMRDRPVGTPLGFAMRRAAGPEEGIMGPEEATAIKEYLKPRSFLERGTWPAMSKEYKAKGRALREWAEGKSTRELLMNVPEEFSSPITPMISPLAFGRTLRGAIRMRAKRFGWSPQQLAAKLDEADELARNTPPGLLEWTKQYKLKPKFPGEAEFHGSYFPPLRRVYTDPYSIQYGPISLVRHEMHGHATQDIFRHVAPAGSALETVQLGMDDATRQIWHMKHQLGYMRRIYKDNPARLHRLGNIEETIDKANPAERVANLIEDKMGQGMSYRNAVKHAYDDLRKTLPMNLGQIRAMSDNISDIMLESGEVFFQPF